MFFMKPSEIAQAREQADNLLRMAAKVDAYRCDIIPERQLEDLRSAAERLRDLREDRKAGAGKLDAASEVLHEAMLRCGGDIYPVTFWGENIEMLLVAAILAIGIRAFFLQPFKIPTNSMYPTYNGMTPYVYRLDDPGPSAPERAWNFLVHGATHYDVVAPADGEVRIPVDVAGDMVMARWSPHDGRKWFGLLAEKQHEYTIGVGDTPVTVDVPEDFTMDQTFLQTYFPEAAASWMDQGMPARYMQEHGYLKQGSEPGHPNNVSYYLVTGHQVKQGDKVLNFDRRTGDMLFVDRFTYNFFPPKVGDPFVFSTSGIPSLEENGSGGQYFIKRLVGRPGDMLEVRPPALFSNGSPIQGAPSFAKEARQSDGYPGYAYARPGYQYPSPALASHGQTVVVPAGYFFAMGDNSPSSLDSRYWGGVPRQNVVGRPLVIVYPFTAHVGLAK